MAKYSSDNTWKLRRVYVAKLQGTGLGKSYARIIMYLCPATEIKGRERFLRKNDHQHSILWFAGEEPHLCAFTPANSSAPLLRK